MATLKARICRSVALLTLALGLLAVGPASAGPAKTNAQGKSLDDLLEMWMTWALGGDQADHFKKVQFMPLPNGTPDDGAGTADDPVTFTGEMDVTLKPGQSFVMPVAGWTRAILETGIEPILDDEVFTGSNVLVTIDGKPVLDSTRDDLAKYYVPPTDFEEPVSGVVGFQAIGFVHGPLAVGEHTMILYSEIIDPETNIGFIYENTWHITVRR